jgi:starch phosphorylase
VGTDTNDNLDATHAEFFDIEDPKEFYKAIDRRNLRNELSSARPYVYWTMEVYDQQNGIKGGGGLGVLAADTRRVAERLEVPFVLVTPFYRTELHQAVSDGAQTEWYKGVTPEEFGFRYANNVTVQTGEGTSVQLGIFEKQLGSTRFVTISEANFGELYAGDGSGDHRLYQELALGFGGYKALKLLGIQPAVIQLNETATIFAAIARLDELCRNGMNLYEAIVYVRKHTLYTNHTLVQAAESEFSREQFARLVMPNIVSPAVRHWLDQQFDAAGRLRLNVIAIELTEAKNGVSRLHARVCDFKDTSGERVKFHAVTNGIDLSTWVLPEILEAYFRKGIIDKFELTTGDYAGRILELSGREIRELKGLARVRANEILSSRKDQNGEPLQIPDDAIIFDFKRRFADYKRPWMPFERIDELKSILTEYNAHFILAGKVWLGDTRMYMKLQEILKLVAGDEVLRGRVHYVQDYDEALGKALAFGSDIAINVPIIGLEACGTSWEKDIANLKLLVSTADGGVADVSPLACYDVVGATYDDEVSSLYEQMRLAAEALRDDGLLEKAVHKQLIGYLPTISGARMMKEYLRFLFDK